MNQEIFEDISGILPKVSPSFLAQNWVWIVPAAALIIAALCAIAARLRRTKKLSDFEIAMLRLSTAKKETADKLFAELVSGALRDYIGAVFKIPAPERTTEEFLRLVSNNTDIEQTAREDIEKILTLCDMAKFAGESFGGEMRELLFSLTKNFIETDNQKRISKK